MHLSWQLLNQGRIIAARPKESSPPSSISMSRSSRLRLSFLTPSRWARMGCFSYANPTVGTVIRNKAPMLGSAKPHLHCHVVVPNRDLDAPQLDLPRRNACMYFRYHHPPAPCQEEEVPRQRRRRFTYCHQLAVSLFLETNCRPSNGVRDSHNYIVIVYITGRLGRVPLTCDAVYKRPNEPWQHSTAIQLGLSSPLSSSVKSTTIQPVT